MVNTYFKMLNQSIQEKYTNNIISDIQTNLRDNCATISSNLYDAINDFEINSRDKKEFDINTLLKYYVLNQILKETGSSQPNNRNFENLLKSTANCNIKYNSEEQVYYKLDHNRFTREDSIQKVEDDGSYITIIQPRLSSYKIKRSHDARDNLLNIQLLDAEGKVVCDKWHAAEILGMKKEYKHRHQYTGYSGNSCDLIASLLNKLKSPIETGLYMDKHYMLYKWSETQKCFIRDAQQELKSPLLTDYEFSNKIVIRKEYTGIR